MSFCRHLETASSSSVRATKSSDKISLKRRRDEIRQVLSGDKIEPSSCLLHGFCRVAVLEMKAQVDKGVSWSPPCLQEHLPGFRGWLLGGVSCMDFLVEPDGLTRLEKNHRLIHPLDHLEFLIQPLPLRLRELISRTCSMDAKVGHWMSYKEGNFWRSFVDLWISPLHRKFHSPLSHSSELVSRAFHQFWRLSLSTRFTTYTLYAQSFRKTLAPPTPPTPASYRGRCLLKQSGHSLFFNRTMPPDESFHLISQSQPQRKNGSHF
ncbi:hypothetical protein LWI28_018999 [Acer negundo]|uniref:Uncharacterized protein n=1 Tax=Acer negundo TaxID=4023 RepID=A0AAD5NNM8_ACENE|nr:hypothetical protein LWI28_018999 [Acer negundo]